MSIPTALLRENSMSLAHFGLQSDGAVIFRRFVSEKLVCFSKCDSLKEGDKARVWEACVFEGSRYVFVHTSPAFQIPPLCPLPSATDVFSPPYPPPLYGSIRAFERGLCGNGGAWLKELDGALGDGTDNEMVGGRKTNFLTPVRERERMRRANAGLLKTAPNIAVQKETIPESNSAI